MTKFKIYPQFGSIEDTKHIKFEIDDSLKNTEKIEDNILYVSNDKRIIIENATHSTRVSIKKDKNIILDLNIPDHSSHSSISLFINIEKKQENNIYELIEICPIIYHLKKDIKESFPGNLNISPSFLNINEDCSININSKKDQKYIFSINDKKINILTNEEGNGSIRFRGKDVLENTEITVVQKYPIYFYTSKDNFVKQNFSGSYLHILPSSIKAATTEMNIDPRCLEEDYVPGEWTIPEHCIESPEPPSEPIPEPTNPPNAIPTKTECNENYEIPIEDVCRINNHDSTLIANGFVLHSYVSVDLDITDSSDVGYNISRVFIAKDESSINVQIITNRNIIIGPKVITDDFTLYVNDDLWNEMEDYASKNYYVVIFNEVFGYQSLRIKGKEEFFSTSEEKILKILIADKGKTDVALNGFIFCENSTFYENKDPILNDDKVRKIPFVKDASDNALPILNCSIASNYQYIENNKDMNVYLIAEVYINNESQLFLFSFSLNEISNGIQLDNWKQLTTEGNNKNPKTYVDTNNNLNIFWEGDRSGQSQVYYGVLGPFFISKCVTTLASIIDKQADILQNTDRSFHYTDQNILIPAPSDEYNIIPLYDTEDLVNAVWENNTANNGSIQETSTSNYLNDIIVQGNPISDTALAFASVDQNNFASTSGEFNYFQFNYQINFNLQVTLSQTSNLLTNINLLEILTTDDIDILYNNWKSEFTVVIESEMSNTPVYKNANNNKFILGKKDNLYDRFVPLVGAYNKTNMSDLKIKFSKNDNDVRHFVLGLMFEKSYFKAINIQTQEEYEETNDVNNYIKEEEHIIYTGNVKLVILLKTNEEISQNIISDDKSDYIIVKTFPQKFNAYDSNNFEIIISYSKLYYEEADAILNKSTTESNSRFLCNIYLLMNKNIKFSESFLVDLSDKYRKFDIGFGMPSGGMYESDKRFPSKLAVYDNILTTLNFSNITITSPTYIYNDEIISVSDTMKSLIEIYHEDIYAQKENLSKFYKNYFNFLSFASNSNPSMAVGETSFFQIPLTIEGINKSVNVDIGICNDINICWQSNRAKYWDIYYANSVNNKMPFRMETRITNTESNSIMPSMEVNRNGKRLITWQDNRDGNYEIYCARSLGGYNYGEERCQSIMLEKYEPNVSSCSIEIAYDSTETGLYNFTLEFYEDNSLTNLFTTISTQDNVNGWEVGSVSFESLCVLSKDVCTGISLTNGQEVIVTYTPQRGDIIFDKVLYTKLLGIIE